MVSDLPRRGVWHTLGCETLFVEIASVLLDLAFVVVVELNDLACSGLYRHQFTCGAAHTFIAVSGTVLLQPRRQPGRLCGLRRHWPL